MKTTVKKNKVSLIGVLLDGIVFKNPVLIQLLGMCPILATSTSLENAFGMGVAVTFVLFFSNIIISLLRKIIPEKIRIAAYIIIIAGFVSVIDMILKAYLPSLSSSLGVFIPLIVVNCIIFARAESFASKNGVIPSAVDGIACGIGFTIALSIVSAIREILGNGTILGFHIFGESFQPATMMLLPFGGFLTLGFVIALVQFVTDKIGKGGNK
ncbi:MAG: electron transport complex subunit RsxE [Clostridia bacterium]|nr:electron transport complex subunit RsxE [Clostridia bacterium]MBR2327899.1 electron transport complex subunit RsxE [Clostridia bacterium]